MVRIDLFLGPVQVIVLVTTHGSNPRTIVLSEEVGCTVLLVIYIVSLGTSPNVW